MIEKFVLWLWARYVHPTCRSFVIDAEWERAEELRVERLGPGPDDIPL